MHKKKNANDQNREDWDYYDRIERERRTVEMFQIAYEEKEQDRQFEEDRLRNLAEEEQRQREREEEDRRMQEYYEEEERRTREYYEELERQRQIEEDNRNYYGY